MRKRLTAALLCLCLLFTLFPATAFAEGEPDSGPPPAGSALCEHHPSHDAACGYTEGSAGSPCAFVCEVCNAHDSGDTATPSDAQPEECTCEKLCTEEEINEDCPVCGAEDADLNDCKGLEAQPATLSNALPATALTAGEIELYIGGQQITESGCYENQNDTWTKVDGTEPASGQFYYDASTATLTLNNLSIEGGSGMEDTLSLQTTDSDASLKIVLKGENYLTGGVPIQVYAENNNASLTITGEGTLTTTGTGSGGAGGIFVRSGPMGSTNRSYLTIEGGANVISNCTQTTAVTLVAPAAGEAILTVQGGNLTADGGSSAGIYYDKLDGSVPSDDRRYLRIANNSVVRTNRLAHATGLSVQIQYSASSGGIYMSNGDGIVYGPMELQEHFEIGEGESLTLYNGASLNTGDYTLTVDGGTLTGDVTGTVIYKVTSVSLNKDSLTLDVGGTATLTATITPSNATNQNVTWSSDNESVATVDTNGKVTAVAPGTATITVTTVDGGKTATCAVTVNPVQYTVTVQTDGNGSASASPASAPAETTVTLTADPDSGYHFDGWEVVSGNIAIQNNAFTMPAGNVTVKAVFDRNSSGGGYVPTRPKPVEPEEPEIPADGWVYEDGVWYYYQGGETATGWVFVDHYWYYLNENGEMVTSWLLSNGTWYYLKENGQMATGLLNLNGTWYYLHDWGGMATGWINLNGTWYYLKDWGGMATGWLNLNGTWYYLRDWGGMATGWLNLNGTWYYLYDWGGMAADTTTPDGYRVGPSGAWIQ